MKILTKMFLLLALVGLFSLGQLNAMKRRNRHKRGARRTKQPRKNGYNRNGQPRLSNNDDDLALAIQRSLEDQRQKNNSEINSDSELAKRLQMEEDERLARRLQPKPSRPYQENNSGELIFRRPVNEEITEIGSGRYLANQVPTNVKTSRTRTNSTRGGKSNGRRRRNMRRGGGGRRQPMQNRSRSTIYREDDREFSFIQIPCLSQNKNTCGIHTHINSEILARFDDLKECREVLSSKETSRRIKAEYRRGQNLSTDILEDWNNGTSEMLQNSNGVYRTVFGFFKPEDVLKSYRQKKQSFKPRMRDKKRRSVRKSKSPSSELVKINGGELALDLVALTKREKISTVDFIYGLDVQSNMRDPRWRFRQKIRNMAGVEVFDFHYSNHWIAVKLEVLPNGRIAAIFTDSAGSGGNKIKKYKKPLTDLITYLRGY